MHILFDRRGAVRALLAVGVVFPAVWAIIAIGGYLVVAGQAEAGLGLLAGVLSAASAILGYYFGFRSAGARVGPDGFEFTSMYRGEHDAG